ncbi:MAG: dihydropteroate synthase [Actinomycetaceae bacterium]|nr:dihydropteroate synthase [Actinomycetaceae bacterium]
MLAPTFATDLPHPLPSDRTALMGIVNITPDSFSDGGKWFGVDKAIERANVLVNQGADIIDVGGESTRPGSTRIDPSEEIRRILEVVSTLSAQGIVVSVDTINSATARAVCDAGARIINDVSGACWDPEMADVMADTDAVCIIQHWRGFPGSADERILERASADLVLDELGAQVDRVLAAGVKPERIVVDPGLGFAKTSAASWDVVAATGRLVQRSDYPVLIGHSRKRFLKAMADEQASVDELTVSLTSLVAAQGAWAVRVHDAVGNAAAIRTGTRWLRATIEQ